MQSDFGRNDLTDTRMPAIIGTYVQQDDGPFKLGISQMPGFNPTYSETADTSMDENSNTSQQFALHCSQLLGTDVMTQN